MKFSAPPTPKKIEEAGTVGVVVRKVTNRATVPLSTVVRHVTDIVHPPSPPVVHNVLSYKIHRAHYDLEKEVVPAKPGPFIKIVKYRSPAPPGPTKVVYVPKPVPVPVPAPPPRKVQCSVNVRDCFAKNIGVLDPVFTNPIDHFTGNYNKMCGDERSDKQKVREKKHKSEGKTKELCSKAEKSTKANNLKYKLAKQKEASSKAVAESKEKYLEKKVKSVQEAAAKGLGASKEKLAKTQEKANKSEDEMYKKECAAKEGAYKAVRESKQKVRVIYVAKPVVVPEVKKPVPAPAPIKKVVVTYVPKPQPVRQQKTTIYVPAPVLQSAAPVQDDGVKEKTHKTAERVQKSADISNEAITKVDIAGKEHVSKEFQQKRNVQLVSEEKEKAKAKKEARCKEQESKESRAKAEIHQKLAVEKVRKELYTKERETKKLVAPAPAPPCEPDSSVEAYVKKCRAHEERFAKSADESEKTLKEVKVKRRSDLEEAACSFTTKMCKDIYAATRVRNDEMSKMIIDHSHKLEAAYTKATQQSMRSRTKLSITFVSVLQKT
jgi:hypothetical protein